MGWLRFRHSNLELYSRISLTFQFPLSSHMLCLLLSLLQLGLRISNCQWHTAETDPSSIPLHSPYSFGSISPNTPKMVKHWYRTHICYYCACTICLISNHVSKEYPPILLFIFKVYWLISLEWTPILWIWLNLHMILTQL